MRLRLVSPPRGSLVGLAATSDAMLHFAKNYAAPEAAPRLHYFQIQTAVDNMEPVTTSAESEFPPFAPNE